MPGFRQEDLSAGAPLLPQAGPWPPQPDERPPMTFGAATFSWPPSADTLDYLQKFITVALLLVAAPALVTYALKSPSRFANAAARRHVA